MVEDTLTPIGGDGAVVKIDESKFGKRKYHKGHRVDGVWVIGGIERGNPKNMFAVTVINRSDDILLDVIKKYVKEGSVVYTDLWKAYSKMPEVMDVEHQTVNNSKYFKHPKTGVHINTIEGTWNGIKLRIPPRSRTKKDIDLHLAEFMWRRQNDGNLWEAFHKALVEVRYIQ